MNASSSLAAAGAILPCAVTLAQCPQWLPAPMAGTAGPYFSTSAIVDWDPDGGGPLPPRLIVAGSFAFAGTVPGNVVAWNGSDWEALGAGFSGAVNALHDYRGDLIAAGGVTGAAHSIMRKWNGAAWQDLGPATTTGSVRRLTVHNGHLIAAGSFSSLGGVAAANVAAWNGTSWSALGAGLNQQVNALATYNGDLYATGPFTASGATACLRLARWTGTAWTQVGGGLTSNGLSLLPFDGRLVIGVEGLEMRRWDGATLGSMPSLSSIGAEKPMTTWGGTLIVGGSASGAPGPALWNGFAWEPAPVGSSGAIRALAVHGPHLVVLGSSNLIGAGLGLFRYDGVYAGAFRTAPNAPIWNAVMFRGQLHVLGSFGSAAFPPIRHVARWDGARWVSVGNGTDRPPDGMVVYRDELIVSGVNEAGGVAARGFARWDGNLWRPLGGQEPATITGMAVVNDDLYAGGSFANVSQVARWSGSAWDMIGPAFSYGPFAFATFRGDLVAAGDFQAIGGVPIPRIARWDGAAWQPLGAGLNGQVQSIVPFGVDLVAAGSFTASGTTPLNRVARWDGAAWHPLGTGANGTVRLTPHAGGLIASGGFTTIGGLTTRIARWDGSAWVALGPGVEANVNAYSLGDDLLVSGDFVLPAANGRVSPQMAVYGCPPPPPCYPNCDGSTAPPLLNVADFVCFSQRFAAADPYANCDGSTVPPTLNVLDFVCFQQQFAAGCR